MHIIITSVVVHIIVVECEEPGYLAFPDILFHGLSMTENLFSALKISGEFKNQPRFC